MSPAKTLSRSCPLLGAVALLTACSTSFDVQIPKIDGKDFVACMADPSITYTLPKSAPVLTASSISPDVADLSASIQMGSVRPVAFDTTTPNELVNFADDRSIAASRWLVPTDFVDSVQKIIVRDNQAAVTLDFADGVRFMNHPMSRQIAALYNGLAGPGPGLSVSLSASDMRDYLFLAQTINQRDGFNWFAANALLNALYAQTVIDSHGFVADTAALQSFRDKAIMDGVYAAYLGAYLKAYFRNGQFISASLKLEDLVNQFSALAKLKDPLKTELENWLKSQDQEFGKIADTSFVSRTGDSLAFPPISVTVNPGQQKIASISAIDFSAVGADLARVVVEALFDAHDQLPGDSKATGMQVFTGNDSRNLADFSKIMGKDKTDHTTPVSFFFGPTEFGDIAEKANTVQGYTATLTGEALRGINIAALNNEALAKVAESMVGTVARKLTEKAGWCYYYAKIPSAKNMTLLSLPDQAISYNQVRISIEP